MTDFPTDAILVALETTAAGDLEKAAAGLLGAAATVGTPVALVLAAAQAGSAPGDGSPSGDPAADAAALGAAHVLVAETPDREALGVPAVDALAAAVELVRPLGVDTLVVPAAGRPIATDRALRMVGAIYEARVVGGELTHEVGGSTDEARWFPLAEVASLERVDLVDVALRLWRAQA